MSRQILGHSFGRLQSCVAVALATLPIVASAGLSWDLRRDWSDSANPNGPWSYNNDNTTLTHIGGSTLPGGALVSQPGWASCSSCRGFWFKSSIVPINVDWKIGDIIVHTQDQYISPYDHAANVTWTSPISGMINIIGNVWMDDYYAARGNQWNLYIKGILASSGQLSGSDAYDRDHPFSLLTGSGGASPFFDVAVSIGDIVKLEIVRTTFDGFFVAEDLTISTVAEPRPTPEAATLLLALFGLSAIIPNFGRKRQRRPLADRPIP